MKNLIEKSVLKYLSYVSSNSPFLKGGIRKKLQEYGLKLLSFHCGWRCSGERIKNV
jgi:hypothetical protein